MSLDPAARQSPEYLAIVERRYLIKQIGTRAYTMYTWAQKIVRPVEESSYAWLEDEEWAAYKLAQEIIRVVGRKIHDAEMKKYSPDQPRVPAGSSDGGQWTDGGGSSGGGGASPSPGKFSGTSPSAGGSLPRPNPYNGPVKPMKVDKATSAAVANAASKSVGRCATYVRTALKEGGIILHGIPFSLFCALLRKPHEFVFRVKNKFVVIAFQLQHQCIVLVH